MPLDSHDPSDAGQYEAASIGHLVYGLVLIVVLFIAILGAAGAMEA